MKTEKKNSHYLKTIINKSNYSSSYFANPLSVNSFKRSYNEYT